MAEYKKIVFVGRLEKDTGLLKFLDWLKINPNYHVNFCGDGELREQCEKFGEVRGFTDPTPFLKKSEYCVPGGYLAALEALSYKCKLKFFWSDKVKEDYWKMSPFYKLKGEKLKNWLKARTWNKLANEYLNLWMKK
jgi:glycosyltransferase involved in cell wall biosynthesis